MSPERMFYVEQPSGTTKRNNQVEQSGGTVVWNTLEYPQDRKMTPLD